MSNGITAFWTMDVVMSFLSGYHDLGFVETHMTYMCVLYIYIYIYIYIYMYVALYTYTHM